METIRLHPWYVKADAYLREVESRLKYGEGLHIPTLEENPSLQSIHKERAKLKKWALLVNPPSSS